MSLDVELTRLRHGAEMARASGDPEDSIDALERYREREPAFVAGAETEPRAVFEYFSDRIRLETELAPEDEADDAGARDIYRLCKAFIGTFDALFAAGVIHEMSADAIYRQAARALFTLIISEIDHVTRTQLKPRRYDKMFDKLDALPDDESATERRFDIMVKTAFKRCVFSRRFEIWCDDFIDYSSRLSETSMRTLLAAVLDEMGAEEGFGADDFDLGEDDAPVFRLFGTVLARHRLRMKSG